LQVPEQPLDLTQLHDFLRDPVRCFFQQRLKVTFRAVAETQSDDEAFVLDALAHWQLQQQVFGNLAQQLREQQLPSDHDWSLLIRQQLQQADAAGLLPVGAAGVLVSDALVQQLPEQLQRFSRQLATTSALPRDFQLLRYRCGLILPAHHREEPAEGAVVATVVIECTVQDWLKQLRQAPDGSLWQLHLHSEALQRDGEWRLGPLLLPWLMALLSAAAGQPVRQHIVAPDGDLVLPPLNAQDAAALLQRLLGRYLQGMQQPLPFVLKLAGAWLQSKMDDKQLQKLQQMYDGTGFTAGLVQHNPYLRRAYADFSLFWHRELSPALAEDLLQPLLQALGAAPLNAGAV
jgi:exodeoxyribonuclease V gamma subunit